MSALKRAIATRPRGDIETAFALLQFFECVEAILEHGDANARDLIWVDVVEEFGNPGYESLCKFWGPLFTAEVERLRR